MAGNTKGKTKAKKPSKPIKVLSAKKRMSAATKATLATNQSQAKFFALPAEICDRIYRLVLGDKSIHVSIDKMHICHSPKADREAAASIVESGKEIEHSSWQSNHRRCHYPEDRLAGLDGVLNLQLICRQIHSEASLLPFTTWTFVLQYLGDLDYLAACLLSEQRKAVARVALVSDHYGSFKYRPKASIMRDFPGLRHVTVLREDREWHWDDNREKTVEGLRKLVQLLKFIPWETAVVCVTSRYIEGPHAKVGDVTAEELRAECREAEEVLLQAWIEKEERQRRKVQRQAEQQARELKMKPKRGAKALARQHNEAVRAQCEVTRMQRGLRSGKVASYSR